MVVVYRLPIPQDDIWYLAYGSNMSKQKFIGSRGIVPLDMTVVTVPGWMLSMDCAGVPYSEPSYGSISPIEHPKESVQLIGTAYKLTPDMYTKVLASEGGGIAYAEIEIRADQLPDRVGEEKGSIREMGIMHVRSLITVMRHEARPSNRYMAILREGAHEAAMPISYQSFLAGIGVYHPSNKPIQKLGAALFTAFWVPLMSLAERITRSSMSRSKSGSAPLWVIALVRAIVFVMWLYHDWIHAPIWGRGDGMDEPIW